METFYSSVGDDLRPANGTVGIVEFSSGIDKPRLGPSNKHGTFSIKNESSKPQNDFYTAYYISPNTLDII